MALRVLYVGGTGQISLPCVEASVAAGHAVTVLNRGRTDVALPAGVETIVGDMAGDTYSALGNRTFDVVCQFRVFLPEDMRRDIATFTGRTGQYVFISSASAYRKPVQATPITERTPLENPFWQYSRDKIACETLLRQQSGLRHTIVRPSHTVRTGVPVNVGDFNTVVARMLAGKPVIATGDGTSLWTLTRSVDLAAPFVRLLGNPDAIDEDFHITNDRAFTWDQIHAAVGRAFGAPEVVTVHVPSETLVRYRPEWAGPLLGDKSWSVVFDNSKVKSVAGDFACADDLDTILAESVRHVKREPALPPSAAALAEDALFDRIAAEQSALGQ